MLGRTVAVRSIVPPTETAMAGGGFGDNVTPVTGSTTVTVHVFIKPPSCVRAIMVAVPAFTPVTVPPLSVGVLLGVTVAVLGSLLTQVTFWLVAVAGAIVAVRVSALLGPTRMVVEAFNVKPVTATLFTVTVHVSVLLPSAVVAVMVAVPAFLPSTLPPLTVATAVSLLTQEAMFWLVAVVGAIVAVRSIAPRTETVAGFGDNVTLSTGTLVLVTVTVHGVGGVLLPS